MRFKVQLLCVLVVTALGMSTAAIGANAVDRESAVIRDLQMVEELRYQGAYEKGIAIARKAQTEAAEIESTQLEVEAIYQLSLLYYYQHDYPQALAEMQVGLARARVHELEGLEADFLAAEGVLEWKQGNLHMALPKLQEAMRIREKKGDTISMASISNNIGIIYFSLKSYEDAQFYYREALKLLEKQDSERLRSSIYINLSEVLIPMDRLDEAEVHLAKALELEQQHQDPQSLAYIYFNLGELASRKNDSDKALEQFFRALELQETIEDKWAIALTRLRLSEEFLSKNDLEQSLSHAEAGYRLAQELNALSLLRDYCERFIELYSELGQSGYVEYYTDQHEWFAKRVSLDQPQEDPVPSQPASLPPAPQEEASSIPFQTVIMTMLGAMILILVFENTRLRARMKSF